MIKFALSIGDDEKDTEDKVPELATAGEAKKDEAEIRMEQID